MVTERKGEAYELGEQLTVVGRQLRPGDAAPEFTLPDQSGKSVSLKSLRGKRVGLITNQTGVDEHGESDIERLRSAEARAAGVQLVRLFSPEHGIRGTEDREQLAIGLDTRRPPMAIRRTDQLSAHIDEPPAGTEQSESVVHAPPAGIEP